MCCVSAARSATLRSGRERRPRRMPPSNDARGCGRASNFRTPRVALGAALRGVASACIDISDGLWRDLPRLAQASGCGARAGWSTTCRCRRPLRARRRRASAWQHALHGGEDYELLFHRAARARAALQAAGARQARCAVSALRATARSPGSAAPRRCCDRVLAIALRSLPLGAPLTPPATARRPAAGGCEPDHRLPAAASVSSMPHPAISAPGTSQMAVPAAPVPRCEPVPERIGKYVIVNEVGRGSTGTVYLSHDPYYGRDVAIKVYNIDASERRRARARSRARCSCPKRTWWACCSTRTSCRSTTPARRTATATSSPSTCTARARWRPTAGPDNLLRVDDVVEIMFKCAKALHYAHTRGVIHRDIKPSNIMLTQDSDVRIIDFGIALVADSDISRIEGIAGSPSYMSPEQVQSLELTNRSDLYSLGAVMYELLTGTRPFRAGNLAKLLHQIVYATPPPIHTLRDDIPEELEDVVATALQKDPEQALQQAAWTSPRELTRVHQKLRAAERAHRPAGAVRPAAPAEVLPRLLARRDLGSAARQPVAGLRRRRGDRQAKARWTIASTSSSPATCSVRAPRHGRSALLVDRRLLRRDQLRAGRAAAPRPSARPAR